jgi:hypothetical protein
MIITGSNKQRRDQARTAHSFARRIRVAMQSVIIIACLMLAAAPASNPVHAEEGKSYEDLFQKELRGTEPERAPRPAVTEKSDKHQMTMAVFLDRLMRAESGGRDQAKNPRSTALGPYQFLNSTFIDVARRHFHKEVEKLNDTQLLALRTNREFSRRAAEAYTRDNASYLGAAGLKPSFPHLRLAFLLGAGDAIKVLKSPPDTPLTQLLSPMVIKANPFMARLTARTIVVRAARDISAPPTMQAGVAPGTPPPTSKRPRQPEITVRCNLGLASCRRWLALEKRKLAGQRRLRISRNR